MREEREIVNVVFIRLRIVPAACKLCENMRTSHYFEGGLSICLKLRQVLFF